MKHKNKKFAQEEELLEQVEEETSNEELIDNVKTK